MTTIWKVPFSVNLIIYFTRNNWKHPNHPNDAQNLPRHRKILVHQKIALMLLEMTYKCNRNLLLSYTLKTPNCGYIIFPMLWFWTRVYFWMHETILTYQEHAPFHNFHSFWAFICFSIFFICLPVSASRNQS